MIIDESSMLGPNSLYWVDKRLRQATGFLDCLFGGISLILAGDPAQLPPVSERSLHSRSKKESSNKYADQGRILYRKIRLAFVLKRKFRQLTAATDPLAASPQDGDTLTTL